MYACSSSRQSLARQATLAAPQVQVQQYLQPSRWSHQARPQQCTSGRSHPSRLRTVQSYWVRLRLQTAALLLLKKEESWQMKQSMPVNTPSRLLLPKGFLWPLNQAGVLKQHL